MRHECGEDRLGREQLVKEGQRQLPGKGGLQAEFSGRSRNESGKNDGEERYKVPEMRVKRQILSTAKSSDKRRTD